MFEGLFQPMHLILILGIALLFFGPSKLPELGRGMGSAIRDFKKAFNDEEDKPAPPRLTGGDGPRPAEPAARQPNEPDNRT